MAMDYGFFMSNELKIKKQQGYILTLEEEKQLEEWLNFVPEGGTKESIIEGVIRQTQENPLPEKSRGFGDTIAKLTSKIGIKPCGGCKKRQDQLNKILPYK